MKCPKCKYTTFDYLDTCPRCGKDMASEKAKLNISSLKPSPPFLLGSLTGDLSDSAFGLKVPEGDEGPMESMSMELKAEEIYDDGSDLDINIDKGSPSEPSGDAEIDLGDLDSSEGEEELELDFDAEPGGPEPEVEAVKEEDSGDTEIDLGDLDSSEGEEEFELEFDAEPSGPETGDESAQEEVSEEKPDSKEAESGEGEKDSGEAGLDIDDLELKLDFDEDEDSEKK